MNSADAAEVVLSEAGQPLGYRAIAERILDKGLWQTEGLTPQATIHARLAVDIKDNGNASRFQRTAPGVFALRKWGLPEVAPRGEKPKPLQAADDQEKPPLAEAPVATAPALSTPAVGEGPKSRSSKPTPKTVLSFTDAAELVLEKYGDKHPMHYRAITEKALALGLAACRREAMVAG